MADEPLGPDYLSTRGIPSSRRGYDKRVMDAVIAEAQGHWQTLLDRYNELVASVEAAGGMEYLGRELGVVGREVGEVLASAQRAADGIRARSRDEADRIEREATERAESLIAEAERQAFDLRRDAWNTGMDLLESTDQERERILGVAKDAALVIRAQAEKDAHRHIAGAEKESSDLIRQARYEADRQLNQARELAQQIIDRAAKPAFLQESDTVVVRDPGIEAQRDELLGEIERIRLSQSVESIAVFENEPRLRPARAPAPDPDGIDLSDVLAAEVEEMRSEPQERRAAAASSRASSSGGPKAKVVTIRTAPAAQFGTDDDVGTLFEALRTTGEVEPVVVEEALPADPFELRDRLVIPIINEGARDTKRRIVDLQNDALAGLRGRGWEPNAPTIRRELGHGLESMVLKAASAGATAAGPLAGLRGSVADPGDRATQLVGSMSAALAGQLGAALEDAGGPEQAAEAVSRVFRTWRNDDAERWIRTIATTAYHDSLISAMRSGGIDKIQAVLGDGPTCEDCPGPGGLSWRPGREPPEGTSVPPATMACSCTVTPAG